MVAGKEREMKSQTYVVYHWGAQGTYDIFNFRVEATSLEDAHRKAREAISKLSYITVITNIVPLKKERERNGR